MIPCRSRSLEACHIIAVMSVVGIHLEGEGSMSMEEELARVLLPHGIFFCYHHFLECHLCLGGFSFQCDTCTSQDVYPGSNKVGQGAGFHGHCTEAWLDKLVRSVML